MKITQKTIRGISILALVLMLAACSTPTAVVQPTQDIPAVRTEAVQTVVARLTIEAALNPTATAAPAEPTEAPAEPEATATTASTNTAAVLPTNTAAPAQPAATSLPTVRPTVLTGGGGGSVALPTATRRSGPDQAQLVSQEPGDGTVFNPGVEFDGAWTFKNIGTSTWTTDYDYRFARGTNYAEAASYPMPHEVKPGETVRLIADMAAPSEAGRTVSNWELVNENGEVFAQFYLVIDVK